MERVVTLRSPIQFGKETIEALTFRSLNAKQLRTIRQEDGYEIDFLLKIASACTGQPDAVLDKLEGDDLGEVLAVASVFMPTIRLTGGTGSPSSSAG